MKKILVAFIIFLFAILLRLWNLNEMGRTWDEHYYVENAYTFVDLLKKGDFGNELWYKNESSGFPPISRYLYGAVGSLDINKLDSNGKPIFYYDYTHARLVSVFLSSLAVFLVVVLGWRFINPFVGITAGIILSMLPLFLGFSQLATLESLIVFFFTATVFFFLHLLQKPSRKNIILTGVMLGLALGVKYTNVLLFPLIIWIHFIWHFYKKKSTFKATYLKPILAIFALGFIVFFIIWPMPWFHIDEVLNFNKNLRYSPYAVPEVFFGKLMLVPKIYYFVYFLITTPVVILFFFFIGLLSIARGNKIYHNWILYSIVAWFLLPFVQSLYNYKQHGIRYIIEIYAPFSLIAAIGFEYLINFFSKSTKIKFTFISLLITYLSYVLYQITPYYLEYFNIVVGGTKNVYEKRLFQLGWWGQGIGEAGKYIVSHTQPGTRVGLAISPPHVIPPMPNQRVEKYNSKTNYDYVIVNYYNVIREGFDDSQIKKDYNALYEVKADGAVLVTVYKHK